VEATADRLIEYPYNVFGRRLRSYLEPNENPLRDRRRRDDNPPRDEALAPCHQPQTGRARENTAYPEYPCFGCICGLGCHATADPHHHHERQDKYSTHQENKLQAALGTEGQVSCRKPKGQYERGGSVVSRGHHAGESDLGIAAALDTIVT
jgi:hypothetical protein